MAKLYGHKMSNTFKKMEGEELKIDHRSLEICDNKIWSQNSDRIEMCNFYDYSATVKLVVEYIYGLIIV